MKSNKYHRLIGAIMILPFIGWSITGIIFFIKPGYDEAFELLAVKEYSLSEPINIQPKENWENIRIKKTILGTHLIVNIDGADKNLNPITLIHTRVPSNDSLKLLLEDSFSNNIMRYGNIEKIDEGIATTTTGIKILYNWNSMSLSQTGGDTDLINTIYRIHYLQWTGVDVVDKGLGFTGLLFVLLLTFLGIKMLFKQ